MLLFRRKRPHNTLLCCLFPVSACPACPCLFPACFPLSNNPRQLCQLCGDCFPVSPCRSLSFVLIVSPCRSLPVPREKSPPSGLKIPLKIAQMGTKNACFAVYRSENRSKNPVNRQTQKDSHKIFCAGCTNKSNCLTIFKNQNFYIPQMDFCKFHDAKNANPAKNAGAILALPTGQGTNPNPDGRNTAQHDRQGRR